MEAVITAHENAISIAHTLSFVERPGYMALSPAKGDETSVIPTAVC